MKILIFGPQGSGKGTQAELIARSYGLPYISTGDIFRYNLKNNTPLGQEVAQYVNAGHLVPDELTNKLVVDRLSQPDCVPGFVLDGYPRNIAQQHFLTGLTEINHAIVIEVSDEQAINRLSGRLACKCGLSYHTEYNPPKVAGRCDRCGNELFRRDDDQPEAIKQRLALYHSETEPVFVEYKQQGKLSVVNGEQSIDAVKQAISNIIV
jgi:adenylate kinase